jgi:glycosyltransferase involved in cell wall biosynthesis
MPGRVLVVAYNFPPIGGVGVQRTLKYATYLPDSGWEPVVLTARNPGVKIRDEEAERNLPAGLVVERAFSPEPVKLRQVLGRTVRRLTGRGPARAAASSGARAAAPAGANAAPAAPRSPNRWIGRGLAVWGVAVRLTFFPDEQVGWVPFAVRRALAVHRDRPFDVVYSSSPPVSGHLAAGLVAHRAGIPWVADFRDPWLGNAFSKPPRAIHGYLQRRIERRIAANADTIVFSTSGLAEAFAARYPGAASRCVVIPNGYDRNDFPAAGERFDPPSDGRFHLAYGGSLYGEHELELFLDGLEILVARRPDLRDRLAVDFIGWVNLHSQAVAARYATPERLGSIVSFAGFMPHRQAVARLLASDALLTVIGDEPNKGRAQGGKLMEYIGLDRPILAVVPAGDARDLLAELNWGIVADPTPEGVADGVERLLSAPVPSGRADPDGKYDRINLARRFAAVLDAAVAAHVQPRGPNPKRA